MPGGVLATSGEVGKASEEACGVLTVSNKIAPAAPKRRARGGGKASRARRLENFRQHKAAAPAAAPVIKGAARPRPLASATRDSARRRASGLGAHARHPREDRRGGAERVEVWRSLLAVTSSPLPTA